MDINEKKMGFVNRHPWELSRTKMVSKYLEGYRAADNKEACKYINIGAGDMYFDKYWLKKFVRDEAYCVDIGYEEDVWKKNKAANRIKRYYSLEQLPDDKYDYILMMDSLEYFEDDRACIEGLLGYLKEGGMILLTLPAYRKLWSHHDVNARLLRRYDMKDMMKLVASVEGLEVISRRYFYFSLMAIRSLQLALGLKIDEKNKLTTAWRYDRKSIVTRVVVKILNIDFALGGMLERLNILLPGLSLMFLCKKMSGDHERKDS